MFIQKHQIEIGDRFGKLTVIGFERVKARKRGTTLKAICQCDCGGTKSVILSSLAQGKTRSCGCLQKETLISRNQKHGWSKTRLYREWKAMKGRCCYKKHEYFERYGGRGISVCEEWINNFGKFRDWALSNGYQDNLSLDRIDPNGGYCPDNCRWVSMEMQANNRTNSLLVDIDGKQMTLSEISKSYGLPYSTVYYKYRAKARLPFKEAEA